MNLKRYEPKSMQSFLPVVWKKAVNDIVTDINGKKYIDFTSSMINMNVGHSNKRVKKYVKRAINKNLLHTYTFAHELREKFLKKLINFTGVEKAFLLSSGTEATEAAVKLMRKFTGRKKILSFKGAMHGRTMAAELMKDSGAYKHRDFIQLPFPDSDKDFSASQIKVDPNKIAGVMIETYQGWSARFLPWGYIKELYNFCRRKNILICYDEIQSGFFRTGKLFGFEHYPIECNEPDLICIGKGIGGGLHLSGVLGKKDILDTPNVGDMSSTHSANPLCCAAGLAVIEELEKISSYDRDIFGESNIEKLLNKIGILKWEFGKIKRNANAPVMINHTGMVAALIFDNKELATEVCRECLERGLILIYTGIESIKMGPPLTITEKNLKKGLNILKEVIYDCVN